MRLLQTKRSELLHDVVLSVEFVVSWGMVLVPIVLKELYIRFDYCNNSNCVRSDVWEKEGVTIVYFFYILGR